MMDADKVILLVEDDAEDVELTLLALAEANVGNQVVVAPDGQTALDYLFGTGVYVGRDLSIQPQVVLLDLKMPKVDGLAVLRRIRRDDRTRHLPVVVLTTSDEERDKVASYDNHANSFIRKPVDFEQFAEAVRQVGAYWLILNQRV
jgi:two-component system, response regulator